MCANHLDRRKHTQKCDSKDLGALPVCLPPREAGDLMVQHTGLSKRPLGTGVKVEPAETYLRLDGGMPKPGGFKDGAGLPKNPLVRGWGPSSCSSDGCSFRLPRLLSQDLRRPQVILSISVAQVWFTGKTLELLPCQAWRAPVSPGVPSPVARSSV